jgi:NADP-dependent 3-hydroxy acid dehydrogenase YdfG
VLGLVYATDAAIEVMKEQASGDLVNVSSLDRRRTRPALRAYSGTKFARNSISKALRQETSVLDFFYLSPHLILTSTVKTQAKRSSLTNPA